MNDLQRPPSFPRYEGRDCPKHGQTAFMQRTNESPWVCGACIEDGAGARVRAAAQPADRSPQVAAAGCPPTLMTTHLGDFEAEVRGRTSRWIDGAASSRGGLSITGPVGTGKSHLAAAMVRVLVERGVTVKLAPVYRFLRDFRRAWDSKDGREEEVWSSHLAPRVLILDDVGSGRSTDADKDRISELLCDRYDAGKPTVIVSNLTSDKLQAELGDRAYSRLRHDGAGIRLNGDDRRKPRE